ncbi:MAG: amino acid permease [Rickettsiaceae bacterium]|nr:MAG: amino acid permease [Rickettsiaceae bacterium]
MDFFRKKTFESVKESGATSGLSKSLGAIDLILFGLGGIIGTGAFVLIGLVAAKYSGPAVMISCIIAGVTCIFVALAYTELAAMLPTSGSVYTYSFVAFGELFAWLMGSVIILELGISSSAVAAAWSGYIQGRLQVLNLSLPDALSKVPAEGGIINLPAVFVVLFVGFVLFLGMKDSKRLNAILVCIKMAAIFTFMLAAAPHFDTANWQTFVPFGANNVVVGSSILFFAFTGFGTIAAAAEECKNPKRDITIGIIGSLILSTIVYVIIGGLATGIVPYTELNNAQPLAHALTLNNSNIGSAIVATGAIFGMTTVIMMNIYGISRIFYVIARDGLLPKFLTKIHPKYDSPYVGIAIFTVFIALLGGFCPLELLSQLSSMAALMDYMVIAAVVMLFRIKLPNVNRPFRCPIVFIISPIAFVASAYLLSKQIIDENFQLIVTGKVIIYWFAAFFVLYLIKAVITKDKVSSS